MFHFSWKKRQFGAVSCEDYQPKVISKTMTSTERSKNFGSPCAKDVMPIIMSRQKTCLFSFIFQNGTYLITLAVLTKHLDCFTLTLCVTNHCGNLNNLEQVPQVNIFKTWQPFYLISDRNCTPQRLLVEETGNFFCVFWWRALLGPFA